MKLGSDGPFYCTQIILNIWIIRASTVVCVDILFKGVPWFEFEELKYIKFVAQCSSIMVCPMQIGNVWFPGQN